MVVRARIRLPAFPSPCLYQIFCFVRAVIHALCCYSFLCLDAFIAHASHSFIVHVSHSLIVHASHSFTIHASYSHSSFMRRTHSLFMHHTHLPFMRRTHSPFMYQPCLMQLGVSLIFSSPWHVSSFRPSSQSDLLRSGRVREQMYIRPTAGSHSCSLV